MAFASSFDPTKLSPELTFSQCVKRICFAAGLNGAQLAEKCHLSKATTTRILRDSNSKGSRYKPTINVIAAIAIGLKLGQEGFERLVRAAYPEFAVWNDALKFRKSVMETNEELEEKGLPLLTREIE